MSPLLIQQPLGIILCRALRLTKRLMREGIHSRLDTVLEIDSLVNDMGYDRPFELPEADTIVRSAAELGVLLQAAGFTGVREIATAVPLQAGLLVARAG